MTEITDAMRAAGNLAYERIRSAGKEARSKGTSVDTDFVFRRFALERLLQRLNESPHAGRWCLKGGMLLLALGSFRTTEDLDLTAHRSGDETKLETLKEAFREISAIRPSAEDGLTFEVNETKSIVIREEALHPTVRLMIDAKLHARAGAVPINLKLDVTPGLYIRPGVRTIRLPATCKGYESPEIPCYPWEQVVAEKVTAMITQGMASTRYRDIYDVCLISREVSFDLAVLTEALKTCLDERKLEAPADLAMLGPAYAAAKGKDWLKMVSRPGFSAKLGSLPEAQAEARAFLDSPLAAVRFESPAQGSWRPGTGWGDQPLDNPAINFAT